MLYFAATIVNSNKKSCIDDYVSYNEIKSNMWRNVRLKKPQRFYTVGSILFNYIGECMVTFFLNFFFPPKIFSDLHSVYHQETLRGFM